MLDAYFRRIGYEGPREPTRALLDALALHHVRSIPFENLDVLLGRPISLEPADLVQKLVLDGRGGYCFEHNGLMLEVLTALGYAVQPISARVRIGRPRDFLPARTHVFLRVALPDETVFVDVGVGALSPTCALTFVTDTEQATPHEARRFVFEDGRYFHQAKLRGPAGGEWADVCEFTLEAMPRIDREVANWFTSASPMSHFKNRLIVARADDHGVRHTILNHEYSRRAASGVAEVQLLKTPEELLAVLRDVFGLEFPKGTRFPCEALVWS